MTPLEKLESLAANKDRIRTLVTFVSSTYNAKGIVFEHFMKYFQSVVPPNARDNCLTILRFLDYENFGSNYLNTMKSLRITVGYKNDSQTQKDISLYMTNGMLLLERFYNQIYRQSSKEFRALLDILSYKKGMIEKFMGLVQFGSGTKLELLRHYEMYRNLQEIINRPSQSDDELLAFGKSLQLNSKRTIVFSTLYEIKLFLKQFGFHLKTSQVLFYLLENQKMLFEDNVIFNLTEETILSILKLECQKALLKDLRLTKINEEVIVLMLLVYLILSLYNADHLIANLSNSIFIFILLKTAIVVLIPMLFSRLVFKIERVNAFVYVEKFLNSRLRFNQK